MILVTVNENEPVEAERLELNGDSWTAYDANDNVVATGTVGTDTVTVSNA